MLKKINALVNIESPSSDVESLKRVANALVEYIADACGPIAIERHFIGEEGYPHLVVRLGERTDVMFIGHFDTVHPVGTLELNPLRVEGDRLYGPGVLDMKSGIVMMVEIARYVSRQQERPNLTLVFNCDEEIGSPTSIDLLMEVAQGGRIALCFESTLHEGLLKVGLRGARRFQIVATGKGGHAAYPEHNINPVDAIVDIIVAARKFHQPANGIVVVPTMLSGADAGNVVPNVATCVLDVRGDSEAKMEEVERALRRLKPTDTRVTVTFDRIMFLPTFEVNENSQALAFAVHAAALLGMPKPHGVEARGASDLNQVASVIPDALEGLGGWGDGLHDSHREHIMISSIAPSAALATMITQLALDEPQ